MTATILDTAAVRLSQLDVEALERLRGVLELERVSQELLVAEQAATVAELTGHGDASGLRERKLANAASTRADELIDEIDDALARLAAHTYGCASRVEPPFPLNC